MATAKWKRLKLDGETELVEENQDKTQKPSDLNSTSFKSFSGLQLGTEIGFSIVIPIAGGVILGVFLDTKLNLAPKLTLSFLFLGVVVAFMNMIRILRENE